MCIPTEFFKLKIQTIEYQNKCACMPCFHWGKCNIVPIDMDKLTQKRHKAHRKYTKAFSQNVYNVYSTSDQERNKKLKKHVHQKPDGRDNSLLRFTRQPITYTYITSLFSEKNSILWLQIKNADQSIQISNKSRNYHSLSNEGTRLKATL